MAGQIQTLHRYRAPLWPAHIEASDVQEHDDKGLLPTLQFKAPSAKAAIATAQHVSGLKVLDVVRVEDEKAVTA